LKSPGKPGDDRQDEDAVEEETSEESAEQENNDTDNTVGLIEEYGELEAVTEESANAVSDTDVAKIGDNGYATLQDAVNAAQAGDTITLLKDVTVNTGSSASARCAISKSLTIDGQGHTISINNRGFGVGMNAASKVDVTFKDVIIVNNAKSGQCIDTRGNLNSLTLDNVKLKAPNEATQPLTIGGNQSSIASITIKNGSVIETTDEGKYGYAIMTFNPVNMIITDSTIKGWGCFNIKAPSSSAGSSGSTFTIKDSTVVSKNVYSGNSNAYGMIKIEDNNINFAITGCDITIDGDKNSQAMAAFENGALNEVVVTMGKGNNVVFKNNGDYAHNRSNTAQLIISGGVFSKPVPEDCAAEGMAPVVYNPTTGTYTVRKPVVTFVTNGGTEIAAKEVNVNESVAKPADPTRKGYGFLKWVDKDKADYDFSKPVTEDITLSAKWTANTYTVAFDANKGTGTMQPQSFTYDADAKALTANAFTRTGYTFDGWNTKADGSGDKYADRATVKNLTAKANDKVTLYAQWSKKPAETQRLLLATAATSGNTSVRVKWTKVEDADGYDVYMTMCGRNDFKQVASRSASKSRTVTVSSLKKKTTYKFYVKAWTRENGKKTYIATSPKVHIITGGSSSKFTNPKKVKVKRSSYSLKPGKTATIRAAVTGQKKGRSILKHDGLIRHITSDAKVATVNSRGKITARGRGTCTIYVMAANGLYAKVKVTVK